MIEGFVVEPAVLAALAAAAFAVPAGHEAGGRLIVCAGGDGAVHRIVGFEEWPNGTSEPGVYEGPRKYADDGPTGAWMHAHTHPHGSKPSVSDIYWLLWHSPRARPFGRHFGIFDQQASQLCIFRVTSTAKLRADPVWGDAPPESDWEAVPTSLARRSARPASRPGRR